MEYVIYKTKQSATDDKVLFPFQDLYLRETLAEYVSRVGQINKVRFIICLPEKYLKPFLTGESQLSFDHWNYFLLAINEHPLYQVHARLTPLDVNLPDLAASFYSEHGVQRFETLLSWSLWLIQRDLHPLYYLTNRTTPVVKSYDEARLIPGMPLTAYQEPATLKSILERKLYSKNRLSTFEATGRGHYKEAENLRVFLSKTSKNEYIYGNAFDDLPFYMSHKLPDAKQHLLGQYVNTRDFFDYDFGTFDRMAKAEAYNFEVKKSADYNRFSDVPSQSLKFPKSAIDFQRAGNFGKDNRGLRLVMGIRNRSVQNDVSQEVSIDSLAKLSKTQNVDISKLPMSQAYKQGKLLVNNEIDSDDLFPDDYFNSVEYWNKQSSHI